MYSFTIRIHDKNSESVQLTFTYSAFPAPVHTSFGELPVRISVTYLVRKLAFLRRPLIHHPSLAFKFLILHFSIVDCIWTSCIWKLIPANSVEQTIFSFASDDHSILSICEAAKATNLIAIDKLPFKEQSAIEFHFGKPMKSTCVILHTSLC